VLADSVARPEEPGAGESAPDQATLQSASRHLGTRRAG